MTNTYKTMNPLGSNNARDLSDNASNFDEYMNSDFPSIKDRFDKRRETLAGNQVAFDEAQEGRAQEFTEAQTERESEFNTDQSEREAAFQTFLEGTGWSSIGAYDAGLVITSHTQTVDYLGQPYSLKPSIPASLDAPYVTTGVWATEGVNFKLVGDNSLRQDLAAPTGGSGVHVKQDDPNARDRSTLDVYRDSIDIADFVTYGDGRDEGVQLQRAINAAYAQGKTLVGRPGWTIGTSVQIDMNVRMSFHINGMNIIPIGRTSGKHITIKGVSLGVCDIKGLRAVVANGSVGTLGGVEIGDTVNSVQISGIDFKDWSIYGFDICLRFVGPNVFILNFIGCAISGASNRNVSYECTTNSGEAIRFIGGNISDAHNPSNTAVGVMVPPGVSPPDIRIDKLSMSYNDKNGDIAVGIVEVTGVHEENKNVNEFWRIRNTVGGEKTIFTKIAGTLTPGPLSAGMEPAQGRDAFIVYDGSTSVTVRDVKVGQFRAATGGNAVADYITKVAAWSGTGGAAYALRIDNPIIDANRDTAIPPDICPELDQAYLTGTNAFDGFTQNASSGMAFTSGADGYGADTRNRAITRNLAGSGSASYNLKVPVKAGDTIVAKVACKTVGATACTFAGGRLIYFTANDFQLSVENLARAITTPNNAAYVVQFARVKAPKGTAYVVLQMLASGLGDNGAEVRFSNEKLWVV